MTEIPEHLLARSRARRAAMGGGGEAAESGEASTTPVPAQAATPAPAAAATPATPPPEPPPPPPAPHVEAYNNRRKIPFWAMGALAFVPLWAYVFQGTLEPPPEEGGALVEGAAIYSGGAGCAGCHGGGGGGGLGPAFTDGAIYETFPNIQDHIEWVQLGSAGWPTETYGANRKPVSGSMPAFEESLTPVELLYVVYYERHEFGGDNPDEDDEAFAEAALEYAEEHPDATMEAIWDAAAEASGIDPVGQVLAETDGTGQVAGATVGANSPEAGDAEDNT